MKAIQSIPPTIKQIRQMQIDFRETSRPIIQALCDIENVTFHKLFISSDGSIRREENYTPKLKEARERLLELLEDLKKQIFGDLYKPE